MVTIRCAAEGDVPLLARLVRRSFRDVAERFGLDRENCPRHPSNCTPDWIRDALDKGVRYFLAHRGEVPCGCVALERAGPEVCYLERLGVLPEHRGAGVGSALLAHAVIAARRLGVGRVEIGVIAGDTALVSWYKRRSFASTRNARFPHLPFVVHFLTLRL